MANRRGKGGSNGRFPLLRLCSHCEWWLQSHEMRMWLLLVRKAMTNLDSVLKNRDITLQKKSYCQDCGLPSSHIQLWELDCKEGRMPKNWCLQTVVLEKTSESLLDSENIKSVNPKGNQPWILTGRTDAEAPVFWSSVANNQFIGKVLMLGKV